MTAGGEDLLLEQLALRSRLNALVHERSVALGEATRLDVRATRPGGDQALAAEAARWRVVAARVAQEIEQKRGELRVAEAAVERARLDERER